MATVTFNIPAEHVARIIDALDAIDGRQEDEGDLPLFRRCVREHIVGRVFTHEQRAAIEGVSVPEGIITDG